MTEDQAKPIRVKDIMTRDVECTEVHETIRRAAERMRAKNVGALPVLDGRKVIGVLTDRDIAVRAAAKGAEPDETTVGEIMTSRVLFCEEHHTVEQAAAIMEGGQIRRLPVIDANGDMSGILSLSDLPKRGQRQSKAGEVIEQTSPDVPRSEHAAKLDVYSPAPKVKK